MPEAAEFGCCVSSAQMAEVLLATMACIALINSASVWMRATRSTGLDVLMPDESARDTEGDGATEVVADCLESNTKLSRVLAPRVAGVEIAGALKNVLAIAAGIVEGMRLGNNCMAALVAQGCSEIRWLATKMGAKPTTLAGLSGSGDIMLTCFVNLSRNRNVGMRLGSGEKLDKIMNSMNQVAEGVSTAGAVIALAQKYHVKMPVLTAVARIIDNELTPKRAVMELMNLPQVEEV
ncbi:hypothetical protein GUJ93_ZPchr0013g34889 [Zizania palustris]|uniref:glycerol-3-phosphate dehydrogenase (NAD(+)) n=1 Tax=Zizania palustris TaxID=103762 RepID=A0A8J5X972_ZIZPA|nr:hypothetical protein GUJ93_ZPchr0013g34889 [Zizania palustris]